MPRVTQLGRAATGMEERRAPQAAAGHPSKLGGAPRPLTPGTAELRTTLKTAELRTTLKTAGPRATPGELERQHRQQAPAQAGEASLWTRVNR